ncbi:tail fiber protein [Pseudomonas phage Psa21]|uniref:Virion structural protein n=1 Tax=Pseudomonas phage Psa21 TaxID=2530023 RepID=A0A481W636_9CAUD|nr:tail fiber protein [Pseudomonas phage Psa21]QBJ02727.1 virion structural protein [Pseudomonas phage Psa21]
MAESNKKGMISGMDSLLTLSGEEFLEVIRMEADGSYKNYRLLVSKIRNNAGLSAYEIAVQNGYVGTVEEWLASLEGKTAYQIAVELGFTGDEAAFIASLKGTQGDDGEAGKSVFEIALENGFIGTEADFLKTLVGKSAYQTALDNGFTGTEEEWLLSIKGDKGDTGEDGDVGPEGKSAFEVWVALPANVDKTVEDYLEYLKGASGPSAYEIAISEGYVGTEAEWLVSLGGKSAFELAKEADPELVDEATWLASLKGDEGQSAYAAAVAGGFVGTQAQWLTSLKGQSAYQLWVASGQVGSEAQFLESLEGSDGNNGTNGKSAYELALAANPAIGTEAQWLASLKGTDGSDGDDGAAGLSAFQIWVALPANVGKTEADFFNEMQGQDGEDGVDGKSAYELAVAAGFTGTQAEWFASLKGTAGEDGTDGTDGQSAYALWLLQPGNAGKTEAEFLASIKGTKGEDGTDGDSAYQVAVANGFVGSQELWLESLQGQEGAMGQGIKVIETLTQDAFDEVVKLDESAVGDAYIVNEFIYVYNGSTWVKSNSLQGPEGRGLNYLGEWPTGAALPMDVNYVAGDTYVWRSSLWTLVEKPTRVWVDIGVPGPVGKSAYQTYIELPGNAGKTEAEFIASLKGLKGDTGNNGEDGTDGQDGDKGDDGDSAYQVAVTNGFVGSEAQWLASLEGSDGLSAYELAVDGGFVGTQAQWLASLKGEKGTPALAFEIKGRLTEVSQLPRPGVGTEAYYVNRDLYIWIADETTPANSDYVNFGSLNGASAYETAVDLGYTGTEAEWIASLKGIDGVDGTDGVDGQDGRNLEVKGTQANLAAIQALLAPADQDAWVALDTGHLHIYVTDAWIDAGPFKGQDGTNGTDGEDGETGASAFDAWKTLPGNADGTIEEFVASLKGEDGQDGTDGNNGESVFDLWSAQPGNAGKTEAEFIASLKGQDGTDGEDGTDGTNGTNGRNVVILGSVANQAALPVGQAEQAAYTTLDTGTLFMWISGAWVNLGVFRGDKGETGETGDVGPAGTPVNIKGEVDLIADLPDPSTLEVGDAYYTQEDGKLYQVNDAGVYNPGIYIRGEQGNDGIQGIQGPAGNSITIAGSYATAAALIAAHPTGNNGEGYLVGTDLYLYGINPVGGATEWYNAGPVRGPQGEQGIQGKTGLKGNTGNTGERGSLWLVLPTNVSTPTADYGRIGDWAVNAQFDTFYKDATSGWLNMGRLVAGDVNSPLPNLGKVVRLGNQWVSLPVDEVPSLETGKVYGRQLKAGETTLGEWVEIVFPTNFPEPAADGVLYARRRQTGQTSGAWVTLPAGITDLSTKDGKNYVRVFESAGSVPIWKELVIPAGGIGEAPTTAGKTYVRSGATTSWVEYVAGIGEAPTDGKQYVRKNSAWVSFDRYDIPILALAATATIDPLINQFATVDNASGAKTVTIKNGPALRAMTLVLVINGAAGTLSIASETANRLIWNTGSAPAITGAKTVLTFLWDGVYWIGAQGAMVPTLPA